MQFSQIFRQYTFVAIVVLSNLIGGFVASCGNKNDTTPQLSTIEKPDVSELETIVEKATGLIAENKQFVENGPFRGSIRRLDLSGSGFTVFSGVMYAADVKVNREQNEPVIKYGVAHIDPTNIDPASVKSTNEGRNVVGNAKPGTTIDVTIELRADSKVTDMYTEAANAVNARIFKKIDAKKLIFRIKSFDFTAAGAETPERLTKTLESGNQDLAGMALTNFAISQYDGKVLRVGSPPQ